ncbi:MAG: hypothetical protein QXW58_03570 [Thermosphaera sp.]
MLNLDEKVEQAERVLRRVVVPGFDVDVVSSSVVSRMRVSRDGEKIIVFVRFKDSDPGCGFCKFLNHALWSTIVERIRDALLDSGLFKEVYVYDDLTLAQLA